jgi:two-component system, cell cycle sensor histidine kinase and response regulator CckA
MTLPESMDSERRMERFKAENRSLQAEIKTLKSELEDRRILLRDLDEIYQAVPSGIVVVLDGRIRRFNDTVTEQLGYKPEELLGRDFLDIVAPESRARVSEVHARRLARKPVPEQYEAVLLTREGRPFHCELRVRKILMANKRAFVVSLMPMAIRREREENRLRSKKMEAVLTMASALSSRFDRHCRALHEKIRGLSGCAWPGDGDAVSGLKALEALVAEARDTALQLKTIARDRMDPAEGSLFDLREVVKEAVSLGVSAVGCDGRDNPPYQVKTYLRSGSLIRGKPDEFRDVLAHLVRNSLEAMPGGGHLYVTSEEVEGQVHLTIMDSGVGVPEQVMDRIFDPFFTTRGGEAAGMGLSVAYAVIRRHGGHIEVTSEKGIGTEIRITIPAASPELPARAGKPPGPPRPEKVLVIAPTRPLRTLLERVFRARGWGVMTAPSASEGLARLQRARYGGVILEGEGPLHREASRVCRWIKAADERVPVVLVAENGAPQTEPGEKPAGPFDLVASKPLVMEDFQSRVMRLFTAG